MTRFFGKPNVALLIGFIMALSRAVLVHGQTGGMSNFSYLGRGECKAASGEQILGNGAQYQIMLLPGQVLKIQCAEICLQQNNPSNGNGLMGFEINEYRVAGRDTKVCSCYFAKDGFEAYPVTTVSRYPNPWCYVTTPEYRAVNNCNNVYCPPSGTGPANNGSNAVALGDPHFKTFNDIFFSYHGQCDLLLMWSLIHEVMIQIRTTRVDGRGNNSSYSYISEAALKIRDDIIEVTSSGSLLINGEDSTDSIPPFVSGSSLIKTVKGTKKHIVSYKVDLGGGRVIELRSNTKSSMVYVDVEGDFGEDTVGLLGSPGMEGLSSRDGIAYSMEFVNSYSESFQVLSDEPMLFQEARSPQYPEGCTYTATTNTAVSHLRRRLSDVTEVSKDEAMEACANAVPGEKMEFCVYDVMLTRDLDVAEDPSYSKHY